jgi:hypothetical protein
MDAVVLDALPRVIDYKYALWTESSELGYEIPMSAYCLALMKNVGADKAIAELWFLKPPMKVVRKEYERKDVERRLEEFVRRYFRALDNDEWPGTERPWCDRVQCGFRSKCW